MSQSKFPVGTVGETVPWLFAVIAPSVSPMGHVSFTITLSAAYLLLLFLTVIV